MDRLHLNDTENILIYNKALEFIGEVRAGISWERFCMNAIQHSDALIDMLSDSENFVKFLSETGIEKRYVLDNVKGILYRLHFNRENDYYLTLLLPRSATQGQITRRWKDLMLIYHPDRQSGDDKHASEYAKKINEVYSVLKDPTKRAEYDRKIIHPLSASIKKQGRELHRAEVKQRQPIISLRVRRLMPRYITASYITLAVIVLLFIFLNDRSQKSLSVQNDKLIAGQTQKMPHEQTQKPEDKKAGDLASLQTQKQSSSHAPKTSSSQPGKPVSIQVNNRALVVQPQTEIIVKEETQKPAIVQARISSDQQPQESTRVEPEKPKKEETPKHTAVQPEKPQREEPQKPPSVEVQRPVSVQAEKPAPTQARVAVIQQPYDLDGEVKTFIRQYIETYEEGDINRFIHFYSTNAIEKNRLHYDDIKRAYQRSFESNSYKYSLKNLNIKKTGDNVTVSATYTIKKSKHDEYEQPTTGDITWTLAREKGVLKIVRVEYGRK